MSQATSESKNRVVRPSNLIKLPITSLIALPPFDANYFIFSNDGKTALLFRGREFKCETSDFKTVKSKGGEFLWIDRRDLGRFQAHQRANVDKVLEQKDLSTEDRFSVMTNALRSEMESGFRLIAPTEAIKSAVNSSGSIAKLMVGQKGLSEELMQSMHEDSSTYSHAINVSTGCVLLAQGIGINDPDELEQISAGGLLHDLGKRRIPKCIRNLSGGMSKGQRTLYEFHPQIGYEESLTWKNMTWGQRMMIYQHHEAIDGSGYPVGIDNDEIHPWAKICSVVNEFERLLAKSPPSNSSSVETVCEAMQQNAGLKLDKELTQCWINIVQNK